MDRQIIYPAAIPLAEDQLSQTKNGYIALSKLAHALLGTASSYSGLEVTPTSPASLSVKVAPGEVYAMQTLDATAFSSLGQDALHTLLKQGIAMDGSTLTVAAPTTSGHSVNYLIQATFAEVDTDGKVLPYYNSANPSQTLSGPGNTGVAQPTARRGRVVLTAIAGASAPTGSQTTSAVNAGAVGIAVVTVATGQTAINSGNIVVYQAPIPTVAELARLASPAFSGQPTAPTPPTNNNSNRVATTAFVAAAIGSSIAGLSEFPVGTRMLFAQTAAPTGWVKETSASLNDSVLRIVTGAAGAGGTTAFSTFNSQTTTGGHTLTIAEMPAHKHTTYYGENMTFPNGVAPGGSRPGSNGSDNDNYYPYSSTEGGDAAHNHPLTTNIKYVDVIIAFKDGLVFNPA